MARELAWHGLDAFVVALARSATSCGKQSSEGCGGRNDDETVDDSMVVGLSVLVRTLLRLDAESVASLELLR